ncbi:MAG TPA: hypothetical protein VGU20_15335 [Stellaceae bacterium]|nr:hypothetical protein [Stellaceae bacterium]
MTAPFTPRLLLPLLLAAAVPLPSPTAPADDPDFSHCLRTSDGVRLAWEPSSDGLRVYLLVKRLDESGNWRVWLRTERANPPFTLTLRAPAARRSRFAWMLFAVTPEQQIKRGEWRFFCTE